MADYKISWLVADHVVMLQLFGSYSAELLEEQTRNVAEHISQGTAPVYLIVDTTGATSMPKNLKEPIGILGSHRLNHKTRSVIFITDNSLFRFIGNVAGKFIGVEFRAVESLEEAIETLLRIDPSLETLREIDLTVYREPSAS